MTAPPELSHVVALTRLGARPTTVEVVSNEAERASVAKRLGIVAVTALSCRFALTLRDDDPQLVAAEADLAASVVQTCVVTLEPFEAPVSERFQVRFVPAGRETWNDDPDSDDEIPYEGGVIDLGEATVEQLALALDPFPRCPGAALAELPEPRDSGKFAALLARRRLD